MSKTPKVPRIIRLHKIEGFKVYCAFNSGEHRIIDFSKILNSWNLKPSDWAYPLLDYSNFSQMILDGGTLKWPNLTKKITLSNGLIFETPLDLDPIVLYEASEYDAQRNESFQIGRLIKEARHKEGLTQEELAQKSGTTKNYISRIENNKSDIELRTLRKIIEIGLGKKLDIQVK